MENDELNPKAKRVLERARAARTPSEADKRRVGAAVAIAIAASAASTAVGTGTAAAAAKVVGGLALARGLAAILVVASVGAGTVWWVKGRTPAAKEAVSAAPIPAPPVAPEIVPLPSVAEAPAPDDPLLAEITLLRKAQRALHDGKPEDALALAARHATLYPRSQVALERDGLRVFALCALGRKSEAHTLATQIFERAPKSPLRASLAESCALK